MYKNVGAKIKIAAQILFRIGTIFSILGGLLLLLLGLRYIPLLIVGLILIFFGPLVLLINSWIAYGFGEIVEKISIIERNSQEEYAYHLKMLIRYKENEIKEETDRQEK